MAELADVISGVPHIGPLNENGSKTRTTASRVVQKNVYQYSDAIFNFSPPTFDLDKAILKWQSHGVSNLGGRIPQVFPLETRVGASLALLGYLKSSENPGLTSVIAASGTIKVMEPILLRHAEYLKNQRVVFQVAAADFDVKQGSLFVDDATVGHVARNLGLPMVSSSLALENDAFYSSVLADILAANVAPAFHMYDGIRGTRQSYTSPQTPALPAELPAASGILDAFKVANELLGTKLAPFEYYGASEPATVYVTLGLPTVIERAHASNPSVGIINVRLYSPFLGEEFLRTLPDAATKIVVVGRTNDLYKDVSATIRLHYGFKAGPKVYSEVIGLFSDGPPPLPETGFTAKVWDSDKAATAVVAGKLTALLPQGNTFTKFDNYISGGVVASDVRFNFQNQFWDIAQADAAVVNYPEVLRSVDVTAGIKQGGKLVIAAASDEQIDKLVPGQLKLNAMAKQLEVIRLDYSQIDSTSTQGRSLILAGQAALWLLSGADVDSTTSAVVHANSWDTELVAATVNQIVTTLKDGALAPVAEATLKEWLKVEIPEKEKDAVYKVNAATTSFIGVASAASSGDDDAAASENIDELNQLGLKKRLIFSEAFAETQQLRPDVPSPTYVAKVKHNQRLTPDDYDRHIFHLELDISGTGLKYAIGEALGIHAPNDSTDCLNFLKSYGVDPEEVFGFPVAGADLGRLAYKTAFQIARDHLDLFGKVPKRFYESLADHATDEEQRKQLLHLLSPEGAEELKKRTEIDCNNYIDVLTEFTSARPSFAELIVLISPLKRREYSIASSQKVHPNEVHLLIVVVDWVNSKGEKRYGQCSKFLSELEDGAEVVVSVKPSVMKLPANPETPIIMAGLGTGLAPFKAFLEEKMWQRDQGQKIGAVYLFLGSRHRRQEYLYGEIFEAYKSAGILTHIGAAFSRDQPEKIYIQHRIQQAKEDLVDAFVHKTGNFYLCGPTWPVPDISAALTDIVLAGSQETGASFNEATLIEDLKEKERYILEVY